MDITLKSITDIHKMLTAKKISSYELTSEYLKRIHSKDKYINSYITVTEELALKSAAESDKRRANNNTLGILDGIPYSLKDNIITANIPTTCASRMLENFTPDYNATVYEKLTACGAVLLGKNNMDEFAMGSSTVSSYFKTVSNPNNTDYVAGGSSGGSAAAVKAGLCTFSLGTDTGGSIRQPASFCGVYGLCPTYGTVSRYGLIPFASSLDRIGPLTRNASDISVVMNAISGYDRKDETSSLTEHIFMQTSKIDLSKLNIAIIDDLPSCDNSSISTQRVFDSSVEFFRKHNSNIKQYNLNEIKESVLTAYYIISSAEASSNLSKFDGLNYGYTYPECDDINDIYKLTRSNGFGKEVKRRIMLGTYVLSSGYYSKYYKKAVEIKERLKESIKTIFDECDIILTPSTPVSAYSKKYASEESIKLYSDDIFTSFVNLAGITALSVPFGVDDNSMPIGIQLIGNHFAEKMLIDIAGGMKNEL